jgi:hypothetical protein
MRLMTSCAALAGLLLVAAPSLAATLYSQGFEVDTTDWSSATRVASGSGGITSASGGYHATAATNGGTFTHWGGYNFGAGDNVATAFQDYTTSVDIYLNVGGGWANNTRFDFDSAINNSAGGFLQDFIFNAGFYNDATGPGPNTNRFVISTGNNSQPGSAYAKDPGHDPIAISTTGWYTFENHFYDDGGSLKVDMSIYDASSNLIKTWTLGGTTPIGTVGGNRYGWFDYNQFSTLAFDNANLTTAGAPVPLPAAAWGGLALLGGLAIVRRRKSAVAPV